MSSVLQMRALMSEMHEAMSLFQLDHRLMIYDRLRATKVVVAWSDHRILVAVRGSSARANFVEDAKVRSSAETPLQLLGTAVGFAIFAACVHGLVQEQWRIAGCHL